MFKKITGLFTKKKADTTRTSFEYESVKAFHEAFDHPVRKDIPMPLSKERVYDRSKWTVEEIIETIFATSDGIEDFREQMERLSKDVLVMTEETIEKNKGEQPYQENVAKVLGQADGLIDALYFIQGSFVEIGLDPAPIFDIVQEANMAKLGEDGKPIIRESDGKIVKPEGWEEEHAPEPKILAEIMRQAATKLGRILGE